MLNYIWGGMILIGIIVSSLSGKLPDVTTQIIQSSDETIQIILKMAGAVCMWSGLMRVAEKSGLVHSLSKRMLPIMKFLFPDIPPNHKSIEYISTNMIANILGLGWAATPPGILAMEEMQKLNKDKKTASKSMCMFMIVNMSSLQLITVNILSYRMAYNSANPAEILGPGILATVVSTVVGVFYAKFKESWD